MSVTNDRLREHVTSVGFSLTLSKNMIETLVLMDHFGGFNRFHRATTDRPIGSHYVTTAHALIRRGLFRDRDCGRCELCDKPCCDHKLTKAGELVSGLLKESGIYQDVLDRAGIAAPVGVSA